MQEKGSGKWREANWRRQLQTPIQPGVMPAPPPPPRPARHRLRTTGFTTDRCGLTLGTHQTRLVNRQPPRGYSCSWGGGGGGRVPRVKKKKKKKGPPEDCSLFPTAEHTTPILQHPATPHHTALALLQLKGCDSSRVQQLTGHCLAPEQRWLPSSGISLANIAVLKAKKAPQLLPLSAYRPSKPKAKRSTGERCGEGNQVVEGWVAIKAE